MNSVTIPCYKKLNDKTFKEKIEKLKCLLENCSICPNNCGVNRLKDEKGICGIGYKPIISSFSLHYGEERPISGYNGSGTIFFSGCNLKCVFCQNYDISQYPNNGSEISTEELAKIMIKLQNKGAHNINLVSPTHVIPQILEAILLASEKGLNIPIVYNTGGYDSIEVIKTINDIIDIYMPDFKYGSDEKGEKYSKVKNYFSNIKIILKEMHTQVGELKLDEYSVAFRGLLIRHLVMPNNISESENILNFIAKELSKNTFINIMNQYYPTFLAHKYPEINRRIGYDEYYNVVKFAEQLNLNII